MRNSIATRLSVATIGLVVLVIASFQGAAPAVSASLPTDGSRGAISGTVVVMAADPVRSDLYRIDLGTFQLTRLTKGAVIDSVSGGGARIVVSAGFSSVIEQYKNGRLQEIPGLGKPHGYTPDASSDGHQVSFVQFGQQGDFSVQLYDVPTRSLITVLTTRAPLELTAFGPDGILVVDKGDGAGQGIVQVLPVRKMLSPSPYAVQLVWGRGPYLAWSARSAAPSVSLFNPSTGGHQTVPGWRALCWSPDGTDLLVTNDRHLGVIELPDVTAVHDLGAQPVSPITGCAWES